MGLIEREAAKAKIADMILGVSDFASDTRQTCYDAIDASTTINAVPVVHGRWVVDEVDSTDAVPSYGWIEFHCSECDTDFSLEDGQYGWYLGNKIPYNACPICGAKMDKEADHG